MDMPSPVLICDRLGGSPNFPGAHVYVSWHSIIQNYYPPHLEHRIHRQIERSLLCALPSYSSTPRYATISRPIRSPKAVGIPEARLHRLCHDAVCAIFHQPQGQQCPITGRWLPIPRCSPRCRAYQVPATTTRVPNKDRYCHTITLRVFMPCNL
ncbi:hypothetical protein LX32DRAFT_310890 [Colletotrichum zoysiae]|uniref:Uncharacterized protein n=1 Tax=Colletotrichum zoysiae TaxID=1216348 RepID=A0AAD9HN44_9PEZI|nr:hypothetical protein LX32DRAFT_310890 [Colletotrichum zoysiae]